MKQINNLRYLTHGEVDYEKWNRVVEEAYNSRVYAMSWFLDRTAVSWNALVWNDYEYVMPLPVRRKFGFQYLYLPPYCQQLGIFPPPPADVAEAFYKYIPKVFSFSDMSLNSMNLPLAVQKEISFRPRNNYLLHLGTDHEILASAYSQYTSRNVIRAYDARLTFSESIRLEDYMHFKQTHSSVKVTEESMQKLKSLIAYFLYTGAGEVAGAYSVENELCAAAFFCRWKDRVVYMNAVSSNEGKKSRAMFFLLDNFFRNNANKNLIFDFEGSMLRGVARFFEGFGATPEIYYQMNFNRLPAVLKWIKSLKNE